MRFRRRSSGRRTGGKRRKLAWGHASAHGLISGNVAPGSTLLGVHWAEPPVGTNYPSTDNVVPDDRTLVKTINAAAGAVTSSIAGRYEVCISFGMIIWESVSSSDADIDPLLVPIPTFDGKADWIWTLYFPFTGQLDASQQLLSEPLGYMEAYHTRSQRKLSEKQGILFVAAVDNEDTSAGDVTDFSIEWQSRALFKLP